MSILKPASFISRKAVIFAVFILGLFALSTLSGCATAPKDDGTTVYLVRHAEKLTGPDVGRNPELSVTGKSRARTLAKILSDKGIEHIHSSDYIRTKTTGAPLAEILGLDIEIYDPRDLPALAAHIKEQGGRHLVVGHSNTTAEGVVALGGTNDQPAIDEPNEYDRLYTVKISDTGDVTTDLSRYGVAYDSAK